MRDITKEEWRQYWRKFRDLYQNAPHWYPGCQEAQLCNQVYRNREKEDRLLTLNQHIEFTYRYV
jgi:hypothetical protein